MFSDLFSLFEPPGASQNRTKITEHLKKTRKNGIDKSISFKHYFLSIFNGFGHAKMEPKFNFLHGFFENIDFLKISQNHWKTNGFHWFLEVRPSNKRSKNDAETQLKKTSGKYLCRIDFDLHFNLRKPPQSLPKSMRDANAWSLEHVWFRDAMDLARKSSKSNGAQRL